MSQEVAEVLEVPVYDLNGAAVERIKLPSFFKSPVRPDLIRRVYIALFTSRLQPKGTDPLAGLRTTAESLGVGHGIARVARIKGGLRAARVVQAVKGRRAHPPRVEKIIREEVNRKEKRKALLSALAAVASRDFVLKRGHVVPDIPLPVVVADDLESISKARDLRAFLEKLGLWKDVERAQTNTRVRAGKGKMRGRRYKKPKSLLIVVGEARGIELAARNMPGVDVVTYKELSVLHLAPGGNPGRLTVFTKSAVKGLEERLKGEVLQK
ncbi:50S ribosomal protein L4 [Thermofilum pendens]|uniref:Large ribosomal subunit protein uL4 n=1 Tax=Thermofilum pendens (strain DSM 2475 / Hrk 5) TaxID=368408 RepID=A1RWQ9_THEPD|nr:50S ribosomal protein L4 [Thermofilum pendens]ABL77639.1 LSU ribosomal protein L4P [Thermofilum pendens Hrk 5]